MQILRAVDRKASPWKNGGGVTWQIAVCPPNAGLDDFDWRLSIAEVASGGPFSSFAGVDRVLTVIEGEGLQLRVDRQPPVCLGRSSRPLAFAGDVACSADLPGGPIRDLNVMVRRGVFRAAVRRVVGPLEVSGDGAKEQVFALSLDATEANGVQIHGNDVFAMDPGEKVHLGPGRFVIVELARA